MASLIAIGVAGCGGGSSSSSDKVATGGTPEPAPVADEVVISGVAATGAAFADASVVINDRTGRIVGSGRTDLSGFFSIKPNPLYEPPLVITASRTNAAGGQDSLVSMADTRTSSTVNVNTISNLVAAWMSATGDPASLATELANGRVTLNEDALIANWTKVSSVLKALLDTIKISINDVRSGPAPANGTGVDQLLDSLDVSITRNTDDTSTIEITIKTAGDSQEMPVIRFTNSTLLENALKANGITATTIQNQPITAAMLPAAGTSAQLADLLKRMTACHALPTATRVSNRAGAASDVTAQECRSIFKNNNPAAYLHFGAKVGAKGAFQTLFSENGTGVAFGQGTFEYKRDNGDIVFSYVSVDRNLVSRNEESVASPGSDGRLSLAGNQYLYAGSVNAMAERREFMDERFPSYISTGYDFKVPLQMAGDREVSRVDVISPVGIRYSLVRGTNAMALPLRDRNFNIELNDDGTAAASSSAFVRLRSIMEFDLMLNEGRIVGPVPYTGERNRQIPQSPASEEAIAAYPPRGIWTFEYFTSAAAAPVARQTVRTRARALTPRELFATTFKLNPVNRLRETTRSYYTITSQSMKPLVDRMNPLLPPATLFLPLAGLTSTSYEWSATPGASPPPLLPLSIRVFGFMIDPSAIPSVRDFIDKIDLTPEMRQATVSCGVNSQSSHCDANGAYLENTWLDGVDLLTRDIYGREYSLHYTTWRTRL